MNEHAARDVRHGPARLAVCRFKRRAAYKGGGLFRQCDRRLRCGPGSLHRLKLHEHRRESDPSVHHAIAPAPPAIPAAASGADWSESLDRLDPLVIALADGTGGALRSGRSRRHHWHALRSSSLPRTSAFIAGRRRPTSRFISAVVALSLPVGAYPDRNRRNACSARCSVERPLLSARASERSSSSRSQGVRSASIWCAARAQRQRRSPRAFARMHSAICFSCGSSRYSRSGWSIWFRPQCGVRLVTVCGGDRARHHAGDVRVCIRRQRLG